MESYSALAGFLGEHPGGSLEVGPVKSGGDLHMFDGFAGEVGAAEVPQHQKGARRLMGETVSGT